MLCHATGERNAGRGQRTAQIHSEGNRARAQLYEDRTRLSQVYVLGCAHTSARADLRNYIFAVDLKLNKRLKGGNVIEQTT